MKDATAKATGADMGLFKKLYTARQQGEHVPAWATRPAPAPAPARPLWYLLPGGRPVRPPGKGTPLRDEPTHFCHEGDSRWRPIDEP